VLVQHHADLDLTAADGYGPLHVASINGHTAAVALLADAGANIDAAGATEAGVGETAVYLAVEHGHLPVAVALSNRGCDLDAPCALAHSRKRQGIFDYLARAHDLRKVRGANQLGTAPVPFEHATGGVDWQGAGRWGSNGPDVPPPPPPQASPGLSGCRTTPGSAGASAAPPIQPQQQQQPWPLPRARTDRVSGEGGDGDVRGVGGNTATKPKPKPRPRLRRPQPQQSLPSPAGTAHRGGGGSGGNGSGN
jgi:hypothetical protein